MKIPDSELVVQTGRTIAIPKFWRITKLRSLRRWPIISGTILFSIVSFAILGTFVVSTDPEAVSLRHITDPPMWLDGGSSEFPLGTDSLGRDVFSRLVFGARISLIVALVALISGITIGTMLGLIAGWFGGMVDEIITRIVDVWLGFPFILVALVVSLAVGRGFGTLIFLLATLAWTPFVRQVRGEVLTLKSRDYVLLSQTLGASTFRIMRKHLLPGVSNTVVVVATFQTASLILVEAFLSFLGAGIPAPAPAWGNMIAEGRGYLQDAWWISVFPGLAILLTTASLSFLGDWIRDFTDPQLKQLD